MADRVLILDYSVDRGEHPFFERLIPRGVPAHVHLVLDEAHLPSIGGFTHVIHTGSALSILENPPFLPEAEACVREACARGLPQMGVCYGHQLLCRALVGRDAVRCCPSGPELGWGDVHFNRAGQERLGVPDRRRVFQFHFDEVVGIPPSGVVLAGNDHSRIQAFVDDRLRLMGFQFHPEFDASSGNALFEKESATFARFGLDVAETLQSGPPDFPSQAVFEGFVRQRPGTPG